MAWPPFVGRSPPPPPRMRLRISWPPVPRVISDESRAMPLTRSLSPGAPTTWPALGDPSRDLPMPLSLPAACPLGNPPCPAPMAIGAGASCLLSMVLAAWGCMKKEGCGSSWGIMAGEDRPTLTMSTGVLSASCAAEYLLLGCIDMDLVYAGLVAGGDVMEGAPMLCERSATPTSSTCWNCTLGLSLPSATGPAHPGPCTCSCSSLMLASAASPSTSGCQGTKLPGAASTCCPPSCTTCTCTPSATGSPLRPSSRPRNPRPDLALTGASCVSPGMGYSGGQYLAFAFMSCRLRDTPMVHPATSTTSSAKKPAARMRQQISSASLLYELKREGLQCSHTRNVCRMTSTRNTAPCSTNWARANRCHLLVSSVLTSGSSIMCMWPLRTMVSTALGTKERLFCTESISCRDSE
mmetsp:Transcript_2128/g.5399  ORF Transcript_2128/g.5399 Transcript_2128/m.5399 type:complete len:409 (-) Transcript_2128:951-2177(-)